MKSQEQIEQTIARLEINPNLAHFAPLVRAAVDAHQNGRLDPVDAQALVADVEPVVVDELSEADQGLLFEALETLSELVVAEMVTDIAADGVPSADSIYSTAKSDTPVDFAVAEALLACSSIAAMICGDELDNSRVIALLNLGFADSLAAIDPSSCVSDIDGLDREWAVCSAAEALVSAIDEAVGILMAAESGDGPTVTSAELSAALDPPMADLLRWFPDIVGEFSSTLSADIDAFLESL